MVKKKRESPSGSQVEQVAGLLAETKISDNKQIVLRFPLRPKKPAGTRAPGNPVELVTNLVKISIKQGVTIYKYNIIINTHDDSEKKVADDTPKLARKLNNTLRTMIVKEAILSYAANNAPKGYPVEMGYNFAYDPNGSILYTLFEMFQTKTQDLSDYESTVIVPEEQIVEGTFKPVDKKFDVKINKMGVQMNFMDLKNKCTPSNQPFDISKYTEYIRAIDFLLHANIISIPTYVLTKYSAFPYTKENQFNASPAVIMNKGFSLSARPAECGLVLNVANTSKAFYDAKDLLFILNNQYGIRDLTKPLTQDNLDRLKREFITKQIEATHHNITYNIPGKVHFRKYRVTGFTDQPCSKETFFLVDKTTKEAKKTTIVEYFKKEYKYIIKYPNLPCVESNGKKVPLEVCRLVEKQGVNRKLTGDETSTVIREMAVRPENYFNEVEKNLKNMKKQEHCQTSLNFGLKFDTELINVVGREITPLPLAGQNRVIAPRDGQYDTRNVSYYKPVIIKKWVIVFLSDRRVKQDRGLEPMLFAERYRDEGLKKGMRFERPPEIENIDIERRDNDIKQSLMASFSKWNSLEFQQAIVIVPGKCQDFIYPYLKYLEVCYQWPKKEFSTRCSCIEYNNYVNKIIRDRFNGTMYLSNILLKHNTKLGGLNFILVDNKGHFNKFLQDGYIFLSVDVCHPSPGDKLEQSVAAVVGMWDLTNANLSHCTRIRVQKKVNKNQSTVEEVGEIGLMMYEVFAEYKRKKNKLPTNIVILRDGVSEGQYRMVLDSELIKVRNALTKLYNGILAPITCCVVQKRNKIRFKRKEALITRRQGREDKDYNIQPGTCVDCVITHPTDYEFYFSAHKAIKGTSRPPRYYVICDEIKFNQYEFEAMVNALSYLSPRCTKSTSIPTPVNLADLAAERGKNIVVSWLNDKNLSLKKMKEDDILNKLNPFLIEFGDKNYKNTLYYI